MDRLSALPSLTSVINAHGLIPKKSLGQHFLLDGQITARIATYAGDLTQCSVIEVGPGPGGLTRSLLSAGAKKVFAIEMDARCIDALGPLKELSDGRLEIIEGDALKIDLMALPGPRKVVANLPYNAGTAMLIQWLGDIYNSSLRGASATKQSRLDRHAPDGARDDDYRAFESLTLMFQKEVAERITAEHGSKDYGRLSVLSQWLCDCRWDFELPPGAFSPPPKVSSAIITLTPRDKPLVDVSKDALEKVVAKAFGQRRKMLRSALKGLNVPADTLLKEAGIDGTLRAEQLDVVTLCRLAATYQTLRD